MRPSPAVKRWAKPVEAYRDGLDVKKELITMKARITFAASALALLSLTGCASQSQIEEQNKQLAAINVTLTQILATQAESLNLQKMQTKLQVENHNMQNTQFQQQSLRK